MGLLIHSCQAVRILRLVPLIKNIKACKTVFLIKLFRPNENTASGILGILDFPLIFPLVLASWLIFASCTISCCLNYVFHFQPMRIVVTTMIELVPKIANICLLLLLVCYNCNLSVVHFQSKCCSFSELVLVMNNDNTNNGQALWMFASFAVHQFGVIKFGKRVGPTANFETFAAALATGYQIIFGVSRHLYCL